jgi:DNA-binding response OmpR family regulator
MGPGIAGAGAGSEGLLVGDAAVTKPRVLVVDDQPRVREVLNRYLEEAGCLVRIAEDGEAALAWFDAEPPDLVLLELTLPGIDGLEVLRLLRERGQTPVIILTARGGEADRVVGLELGADDYVTKPFSPRELVARIRAVLRRTSPQVTAARDDALVFDGLAIDARRREVVRNGQPVKLTRTEFDLLHFLAARPGTTFTRSQLLEHVWDFAWSGDTATLTVHMRRLRKKVEDDPSNPTRLVTVYGVGYRFDSSTWRVPLRSATRSA